MVILSFGNKLKINICMCALCRVFTSGRPSEWNPVDPLRGDGVFHQTLDRSGHQHNPADPGIAGGEGLVHTGLQPHRLSHQVLFVFLYVICLIGSFCFDYFVLMWLGHLFLIFLSSEIWTSKYKWVCLVVIGNRMLYRNPEFLKFPGM